MSTYYEKLRDPRWQKKRLEIMQRDGFACRMCGDKSKTLNVHHGYYARKTDPWEYPEETLWTLCEACHEDAQHNIERVHEEMAKVPPSKEYMQEIMELCNAVRTHGTSFVDMQRDSSYLACAAVMLRAAAAGVPTSFILGVVRPAIEQYKRTNTIPDSEEWICEIERVIAERKATSSVKKKLRKEAHV